MLYNLNSITQSCAHLSDVWCCLFTLLSAVLLSWRHCQRACVWCSCLSVGMFFPPSHLSLCHHLFLPLFSISLTFFPLLFFLSPWCWKTLAPISNCSLAVCLFLSVFLVLLLLWREATGDPVWLQNCTEIRLIMALQKDLRQILRLCASFAHAHKHKHIPRKTPRLRHMDIYCRVKDVHIYVEMKRDCVLSYKCQLKCTRSPKWSSPQHTSG